MSEAILYLLRSSGSSGDFFPADLVPTANQLYRCHIMRTSVASLWGTTGFLHGERTRDFVRSDPSSDARSDMSGLICRVASGQGHKKIGFCGVRDSAYYVLCFVVRWRFFYIFVLRKRTLRAVLWKPPPRLRGRQGREKMRPPRRPPSSSLAPPLFRFLYLSRRRNMNTGRLI